MKAQLGQAAKAARMSEAELIRAALAAFLAEQEPPAPRLPLFRSGDPGLARLVAAGPDEALRGFGER